MKGILQKLLRKETLTEQETHDVMIGITESRYPNEQIAAMFAAIQMRGASTDEILGFRSGLLETGLGVDLSPYNVVDIVGTGGDGKNTFNISTCACFVLAGAGFKVAKHGNYASSSVSGASNVLEEHGVKFTNDNGKLVESLEKCGMTYMHAPLFAKGMKNVVPVRKAMQVPTIFNLLGPLINPCRPKCQCLGTATLEQQRLYKDVYERLGLNYVIVSSVDGYDEVSLTSDFKISANGLERICKPSDWGLPYCKPEDIYGGSTKEEAKKIFDDVLENKATDGQKNVVIANAAVAMQAVDNTLPLGDCFAMAKESIESGKALDVLKKFVEINS